MSIMLPNEGKSRLDDILYALCTLSLLDKYDTPNEDRINEYYKALLTGDLSKLTFMPKSRIEKLLHFLTIGTNEGIEVPKSRIEYLLYVLAGLMQVSALPFNVDERSSRHEKYLMYLIENGGVGVKSLTVSFFNNQEILNSKEGSVENLTFKGNTILTVIKENILSEEVDTANVEYSDSEYEGEFKSAILKGQTLVNVNRSNFIAISNVTTDYANAIVYFDTDMKANTTYTIIAYSDNLYEYRLSEIRSGDVEHGLDGVCKVVGTPFVFTTSTDFTGLRGYLNGNSLNIPQGTEIKILIVEGDHSNEDLPYFTGIQSVKMPVLTISNEDGTKTNILTVNEEVELRGIGEVRDELDLLTGELTKRIGKIVLNGSGNDGVTYNLSGTSTNTIRWYITIASAPIKDAEDEGDSNNAICDTVPYKQNYGSTRDYEGFFIAKKEKGGNRAFFRTEKSRLSSGDITGLKKYLAQNPITLQYQLATESVKTVDLNIVDHSDNTLEKMSTFKDGHIILSSEEGTLIPSLTYSIVRSDGFELTNLKSNNTYTVQTNEKEFTLNGVTYPEIETSSTTTASVDKVISIDDIYTRVDNVEKMVLEGVNYGNLLQESVPSRISTLTIVDDDGIRENTLIFNEEIILRSNNTTKDTLDLLTGQLTRYFDTNGNLLEAPTTETVTYTVYNNGASDDVLALIPDGNIIFDSVMCPRLSYKFDVMREILFSYNTISSKELYTKDENFTIVYGDHRREVLPRLDGMSSCVNPSITFSDGSNGNTHEIEGTFRSVGTKFDEVDVINNIATINFGTFTLDGTENWVFLGSDVNTTAAYVQDYLVDAPNTINVLSACSIGCGNVDDSLSDEEGVYLNGLNRYVYVRINNDKLQSQDVAGIATYLNENPIEVIYQLANPVTMNINITSDGAMVSYEDVTYVSLTSDSGVLPHETTVRVVAKTKVVVDEVSALSLRQNETEEQIEEQSDENLISMVATTEIYENLL